MICHDCKTDSKKSYAKHPYRYVTNTYATKKPFRGYICNSCYTKYKDIIVGNLKTNPFYSVSIVPMKMPWQPTKEL
jgi:hypothetical protein